VKLQSSLYIHLFYDQIRSHGHSPVVTVGWFRGLKAPSLPELTHETQWISRVL